MRGGGGGRYMKALRTTRTVGQAAIGIVHLLVYSRPVQDRQLCKLAAATHVVNVLLAATLTDKY